MIEVLTNGALNSIQDVGRHGFLRIGVTRAGAMDSLALAIGNLMLGNPDDSAGVEISIFPFSVRFLRAARFAITGADCAATLDGRRLLPWWTLCAFRGQTLTFHAPDSGARAYLTVEGGFDVPTVLGSRSTDLKSGFGGFFGRALRKGDRLAGSPARRRTPARFPEPGFGAEPPQLSLIPEVTRAAADVVLVRVIPAAQYASFAPDVRELFWRSDWLVMPNSNRMGFRLAGPELKASVHEELFSYGIVPGVIQVPPSGKPIIQMSDANTVGGYPKIGTVIEPDLWRLAQARLGQRIRFRETTLEEGTAALAKERDYLSTLRSAIARFSGNASHTGRQTAA